MDINLNRYFDACSIKGMNKKTFLNKWRKYGFEKFYKLYEKEYQTYTEMTSVYYDEHVANGMHGMDIVSSDGYKNIVKNYDPVNKHKVIFFLLNRFPLEIECWLCCGWKLKYVPSDGLRKGYWTWIDRYHMMTKLCRYGSPMWLNYKFTWWDKLRFKWITGYKYEEVK